jgi:hypothetical protein
MRRVSSLRLSGLLGVMMVWLVLLPGCATLFAGGPDHVPISTNPPGATVFIDNIPVGQTPLMVALDRQHSSGSIRIELPGFQPVMLLRSKSINGWFWVSICLGGIVGIVVDLVTGNVQAFDDAPIAIGLTPAYGQPVPAEYPPPAAAPPGYPPTPPPAGYPPAPPAPPPPPR